VVCSEGKVSFAISASSISISGVCSVRAHIEVHFILSWENVHIFLVSKVVDTNVCLHIRVTGWISEVEIIEFASWLHHNNRIT
jgi:hypothetical protein